MALVSIAILGKCLGFNKAHVGGSQNYIGAGFEHTHSSLSLYIGCQGSVDALLDGPKLLC